MTICEFCLQYQEEKCAYGLSVPRSMGCREFDPGIERFCSKPSDFVGSGQIIQMATFFGIKGKELKKIKAVAVRAEQTRLEAVETRQSIGGEQSGAGD